MLRKVAKIYRCFIIHHIVTGKRLRNFQESNIFVSKYFETSSEVKAFAFQTFLCGVGAGVYFGQCFDFRSCISFRYTTT